MSARSLKTLCPNTADSLEYCETEKERIELLTNALKNECEVNQERLKSMATMARAFADVLDETYEVRLCQFR